MNGIVDTLNNLLASAQAITDVTQYNLYARIGDYIDYLEKEPSLQVVVEDMDKNASLHESLDKLKALKEIIDAPDVLLDGWEKERGLDALQAIQFAFRHGGIKSLKNRSTEPYNKKREIGLKSEDYMGHLTNVHYALIRRLEDIPLNEARPQDNNKSHAKTANGIELEVERGNGILVYKGKPYKVGKANSRKFRLLKVLSNPTLNVSRTYENVIASISIPKDSMNKELNTQPLRSNAIKEIIKNALGDLKKAVAEQNANFTFRAVHDKSTQTVSLQMIEYDE